MRKFNFIWTSARGGSEPDFSCAGMIVGELKKLLADLPDSMPVKIESSGGEYSPNSVHFIDRDHKEGEEVLRLYSHEPDPYLND